MAKTPITLRGLDVSMAWAGSSDAVQYTVCKVTTTEGNVDLAAAIADYPLGILQNAPKAAANNGGIVASANVRIDGWSYAVSGAVVACGDRLKVDSSGRVITAAKAAGFVATTFKYVVGTALSAAAAANEWITVEINRTDADI